MRLATLAFLTGIILLQGMSSLPVGREICYVFILLPLFYYRPLRIPLMFLFGFAWALFRGQLILLEQLPEPLIKQDLEIEGVVIGLTEDKGRYQQFRFKIEHMELQGQIYPGPGLVRLNWYKTQRVLRPGDRYRLTVRLKPPNGMMNPAGFDYEAWLFQQRIRATGYVRNKAPVVFLGQDAGTVARLHRLRSAAAERITRLSLPGDSQALIVALAIGERSEVSSEQWQVLRSTGTTHLLAISGLHIGLVAGLAFWLGRFVWSRSLRLMLAMPAQQAGAIFAIVIATLYAAMAGFSIPTQRALIMVLIMMWGWLSRRSYAPSTLLSYAALGVLVWDPLATLSAGFWLSFVAVATILLLLPGQHRQGLLWRWGRLQTGIFIGLMPLLLFWFQSVSLSAPLVNLLAIPWISLVVMPLLFAAMLLLMVSDVLAQLFLHLAQYSLDGLFWAMRWLVEHSSLFIHLASPDSWGLMFAGLGVIWLLLPQGIPSRWLGGIWLLPLFLPANDELGNGEARFTLLDVGQGLAAVIETRDHVMVFDTGPAYSAQFNTGETVVLPYLHQQGWSRLDLLLISHGDNDHIGGASSVINAMPIDRLLTSVPALLSGSDACLAGQAWNWNQVNFELLHPGLSYKGRASENNRSCVLKVTTNHGSILLTGDIERAGEEYLLKTGTAKLTADYLVAPHHGSRSSSTEAFVRAIRSDYVLFPVGYLNRYHFPHQDVRQRFQGAAQYDTASHGALIVELSAGSDGVPVAYRQKARRYWHRGE